MDAGYQRNCGVALSATLWLRAWYGLRTFVLLAALIYTAYIDIQGDVTSNWDDTREMGLSQSGYCNVPNVEYRVIEYNINSNQQPVYVPVCAYGKGDTSLCLSTSALAFCKSSLQNVNTGDDSVNQFTSYFNRATRNYFPYSFLVYTFVSISFVLTFLYESDGHSLTDGAGAFNTQIDKKWVIRGNSAIVTALGIVFIVAGSYQIFIYQEDCESLYNQPSGAKTYCFSLLQCGLTLSSTIYPRDELVRQYHSWCLAFAVLLFVSSMMRACVSPSALKNHHRPRRLRDRLQQLRAGQALGDEESDEENHGNPRSSQQRRQQQELGGLPVATLRRHQPLESEAQAAAMDAYIQRISDELHSQQVPIVTAAPTSSQSLAVSTVDDETQQPNRPYAFASFWNPLSNSELVQVDGECAFCLQSLSPWNDETAIISANDDVTIHEVLDDNYGSYRSKYSKKQRKGSVIDFQVKPTGNKHRRVAPYSPTSAMSERAWAAQMAVPAGQEVVRISCAHLFHARCLEEWLDQHDSCPVCRATLLRVR